MFVLAHALAEIPKGLRVVASRSLTEAISHDIPASLWTSKSLPSHPVDSPNFGNALDSIARSREALALRLGSQVDCTHSPQAHEIGGQADEPTKEPRPRSQEARKSRNSHCC